MITPTQIYCTLFPYHYRTIDLLHKDWKAHSTKDSYREVRMDMRKLQGHNKIKKQKLHSLFILRYENKNPFYTGISWVLDRIKQGLDKIKYNR